MNGVNCVHPIVPLPRLAATVKGTTRRQIRACHPIAAASDSGKCKDVAVIREAQPLATRQLDPPHRRSADPICYPEAQPSAGVVKLADARDSKSRGVYAP